MKKKLIMGIGIAVIIATLAAMTACSGTGGDEVVQQQVTVARGDLTLSVSGNGKVETSRDASLAFGGAGKVSEIAVKEGDNVKSGDILAKLDTRSLELGLKRAQLSLTQAEGALIQAQLAQRVAEDNLDNLRDSEDSLKLALLNAQIARDMAQMNLDAGIASVDFTAANAALNRAKTYYEYVQEQLKTATTDIDMWLQALDRAEESLNAAQAAYDNALAGYDSSQANLKKKQLEAAELSVTLAQKNIDDLDKNIALQELQVVLSNQMTMQAQQAVDLAQESLVDAQKQLEEAMIIAPFDGIIAVVLAEEGDNLPSPTMSSMPVIQMVNPNFLELVIEVDEIDIPSVELAQEAVVEVDALPDASFSGHVAAIYPVPVVEGGIVLYKVKIDLEVPENSGIKVGMSSSAEIISARHTDVLVVPSRAVTKNSYGQTVVNVRDGDEIQERAVVVGMDDGMQVEIVSGLNEGDTVIVEIKVRSSSGGSIF